MMSLLRRVRPTGAWVTLSIAPVVAFVATMVDTNYQTDYWHHLARGREIVRRGELLNQDIFSFTVAGKPFQDANWLAQVAYAGLFQLGGFELTQLVNSLVVAAAFALLVRLALRFDLGGGHWPEPTRLYLVVADRDSDVLKLLCLFPQ